MRSSIRPRLLVGVAALGLLVAAVAVLIIAERRVEQSGEGVRIPSGCTTEIEVSGGTRFTVVTELDGPALAPPDACVEVPAGRRAVTAVRVSVDGGDETAVVPGDGVALRLTPGRHDVTVIAEGAPGEAVAVVAADRTQARTDGRITAMVLLVAAVSVAALLPVVGRRRRGPDGPGPSDDRQRPVIAVTAGPWAPPDGRDRLG
jgi:hypothetical protein